MGLRGELPVASSPTFEHVSLFRWPALLLELHQISLSLIIMRVSWSLESRLISRKKERTTDLVIQAIKAGFRGIDTACQPKVSNTLVITPIVSPLTSPWCRRRHTSLLRAYCADDYSTIGEFSVSRSDTHQHKGSMETSVLR
jgi:hypothetical protein